MTEKFIDLGPQIAKEAGGLSLTSLAHEHQLRVLKWLDEHPDQVPGRTMTASEFGNYNTEAAGTYGDGFRAGFERAGGEVVPDPEPTNAQSIDKLLTEFANLNASCGGEQGDHDLAEFLDAHGVKAPGVDDE